MTKLIYLDYAASTPVDKEVDKAMAPYFTTVFGNPHALHRFGQEASAAVFAARRKIAVALKVDYRKIVFTGSATEANNLAIRGAVKAYQRVGRKNPRIITSTIEHESVLETCRDLERDGVEVVYAPVSKDGIVNVKKIKESINERTVLVSIMHANNETGVVQPISEIAKEVANYKLKVKSSYPLLHTDAVQSFQYLDCRPEILGVDLLTISAHKIYGPKGIGALYVKNNNLLSAIITGSGQEQKLRSGTDNVPYIVGLAKAVEINELVREKESLRVIKLRDYFWQQLKKRMSKLEINGSLKNRLPNNLNIYFSGEVAHDLQIQLDLSGVAVSPGAACSTRVSRSSYALEAMGFSQKRSSGSLRFSLGRQTTRKDIDYVIKTIYNLPQF